MAFPIHIGALGAVGIGGWPDAIDQRIAGWLHGSAGEAGCSPRGNRHRLAIFGVADGDADRAVAVRQPEGFGRGEAEHAAGVLQTAGDIVFQRIAFAPVFASEVDHQPEEKQEEGDDAQQGDVDGAG